MSESADNNSRFTVSQIDDVTVIRLTDPRLADVLIVNELEDALLNYVSDHQLRKVVVDFSTVTHCTSTVINSLIRAKNRVVFEQGDVKLACMTPLIRSTYRVLNLDGTVFQIFDSIEDATAAFESEPQK